MTRTASWACTCESTLRSSTASTNSVEELVKICDQLKEENRSLRQRQELLVAEQQSKENPEPATRLRYRKALVKHFSLFEHYDPEDWPEDS